MSHKTSTDATFSIDGGQDDLRAEFDAEFDWDSADEYRADTAYCDECGDGGGGTGSSIACCV